MRLVWGWLSGLSVYQFGRDIEWITYGMGRVCLLIENQIEMIV